IGFLNYYYRSARSERAQEFYKTGNDLLQQNRDDEAVQQFRDALSASPGNEQYRLALGLALVKDTHPAEASVYLRALLKRDPGNGPAAVGEARIAAMQGKRVDAVRYYHQAIDGSWPAGEEPNRMQTRYELASLLEKSGQKTQAVAELLAALGPAVRDATAKKKIGQLLLGYGAPRDAADVFQNVIQTDSHDAEAYADLGTAELALNNYREARDSFQKALQWNPSDVRSKQQLELSQQVLSLDPDARGLRAAERYERSKALLEAEVMRLVQCQRAAKSGGEFDPTAIAQKALGDHPRSGALEDAAEKNLALAEDLWKQEQKVCGAGLSTNDAAERVLARLSQQ
ncbi:MAG: tetratricopeptide repeat protein, partial [Bryobacterales bacterium]|nr:tetratricopeptide repeat protein [Bryobacterales bacterium]